MFLKVVTAIEDTKEYITKVSPAVQRYFDPYAGTGAGSGTINMLDGFGWGNYDTSCFNL